MTTQTVRRGSRIVSEEITRAAKLQEARAAQVAKGMNASGYNDMRHDNYANYLDSGVTRTRRTTHPR